MSEILFSNEFFSSLISSETSNHFSLSDYFTAAYSREYDFCDKIPYELCHKSVSVASPFSYEASKLNALCIIHTTKGAGRLYIENSTGINDGYDLVKDTLVLADCRKNHKLVCHHNIWEYTICFVNTIVLEYYFDKIIELGNPIYRLDKYADIFASWEQLLKNDTDDELHGIMRSRSLINLFSQLYLSRTVESTGAYHIPSYIADIHKRFDTEYSLQYSLDELSLEYKVNKFRLCREFAKYYECTPIQYLNKVRIEKAKELLRESDEKIVDISQLVGMDNTNNFIRLFKEKTGVTPLTYRKETPIL